MTRLALPTVTDLLEVPRGELPAVLVHLAALQTAAATRLGDEAPAAPAILGDRLLSIPDAAERIGMSADYLYRHPELPFMRRIGRRSLRVSSGALDRWLANRGHGR